jgi:hypothetical protein
MLNYFDVNVQKNSLVHIILLTSECFTRPT